MTAPTRPTYRFYTATSLDGFLADEHDSLDWLLTQPLGAGTLLDYDAFYAGVGALIMGSATYQWVLDHPQERLGDAVGWPYDKPTFVFSHRDLERASDAVTVLSGTPAEHREAIETAAGDHAVWVMGGGDLAAQFARAGMLDEVLVSIAPVTLGAGRPLLGGRVDLQLQEFGRNEAFLEARYTVVREHP